MGTRPEGYWRSLLLLNLYRLVVAGVLLTVGQVMAQHQSWADYDARLFSTASGLYLVFGAASFIAAKVRWPRFNRQLTVQVLADIAFITTIMYASGGVKSGFGLLLVVSIAAASLVSHGRLALFYAATASIAVLLEQSWQFIAWNEQFEDYTHAVMLSLSFFATALLAYSFARRTEESEALASQRGVDLANLAEVNQLIIRDMPDGVLVVDRHLKLRQLNEQARILMGMENASEDTLLEDSAPQLAALLHSWMSGKSGLENNYTFPVAGRELQLRLAQVGSGRELGAVVFVSDQSQLQSQAQQLKLAALGRLTANIAHEIRNPLSAISHASQLLLEDAASDPTQQRLLNIIGANVQRLDGMVQDVLQLNRRDRAKPEPIVPGLFLPEFHTQFCQTENILAGGFSLGPVTDLPPILFDPRQLQQILWNLCRNGWRHSQKTEGSLQLSVTVASTRIQIDIQDDGPGVSNDALSHLFEPFFTTESSGTGLGLYIARELCEANGAWIEYIAPPERGAMFRIHARRGL
ncbi:two-component system, NtrC family, sensor histidine kinase PilS [Novimethylophilus kurashikiensis]|uniref:histidine kinase n=1 Tax=Novimethylophilus kurashikiensis TaxID=1825523 RepID=A0A2R5F5E2_9PROT|nr:ATP-binding protein [Novimethylophilus kurashikiensis]GBG13562.1 two-component system, NtrC family, sensor histidine kinase PilS [Novimethylophilus kurashikiensis]